MNKKAFLFLCLNIFSLVLNAQDLTGKWVVVNPSNDTDYYAELNLIHNGGTMYGGYSYDRENGGYCRYWLEGDFDIDSKGFKAKDVELIDKSPNHTATHFDLKYTKEKDGEYLVGTIQTVDMFDVQSRIAKVFGLESTSPKQKIKYKKVDTKYAPYAYQRPKLDDKPIVEPEQRPMTPEEIAKTPVEYKSIVTDAGEINKSDVAKKDSIQPEIIKHKNERNGKIVANIQLNGIKEIKLLIYDYGEIDNDTVSIFFNNELIANEMRIDRQAKEFTLKLKKGENQLVFVANNLGDVPPNTAKIGIVAENRRYNYKIFTDEKNNAVIRLLN
ncbi:hypothetical protein EDM00_01615 [Ornithobacterium rhinotracheale]|uniref:hypothetical protein n=1 Tax=Ornithobacterium rhinotracheale TaxID=28251 RepID=UPI00129C4399|nr:hypothetical protein [Ornithobacterium rhinotracheale]MRI62699.1 hypothetical protein [Ornithobacterium rhinotracheale]